MLDAQLRDAGPVAETRFPAALNFLRATLWRRWLARPDAIVLQETAERFADPSVGPPESAAEQTRRFLSRLIAMCLGTTGYERPSRLAGALRAFTVFRAESAEPIPEAFALAIELARLDYLETDAVRLYREFLACSGQATESDEHRLVTTALKRAKELGPSASGGRTQSQ